MDSYLRHISLKLLIRDKSLNLINIIDKSVPVELQREKINLKILSYCWTHLHTHQYRIRM